MTKNMSMWCDNPIEHEREGQRDYERRGRYGYDSQQYNDHWDDCAKHYRQGFDEAKREDERRQERYEEEMAERRAADRRHRQHAQEQQEEEYYYSSSQEDSERESYERAEQQHWTFEFHKTIRHLSRKRRRHICRQKHMPVYTSRAGKQ